MGWRQVRAGLSGEEPKHPDTRDWDHLHGHHLASKDVFLTWDKPILRLSRELHKRLGLTEEFPQNHRYQRR